MGYETVQALDFMKEHPGHAYTTNELRDELGLRNSRALAQGLRGMLNRHEIGKTDDDRWYYSSNGQQPTPRKRPAQSYRGVRKKGDEVKVLQKMEDRLLLLVGEQLYVAQPLSTEALLEAVSL
jgi:hypothetical protein